MDDINTRIEMLNSYKRTNVIFFGITVLFLLIITIWAGPQADTKGEFVILIYLAVNMLLTAFFIFKNVVMVKKILDFPNDPKKYYERFIDLSVTSNDVAPLIFFLPILLSILGIWAIDMTSDNQPLYWIYIVIFLLFFICLYRFFYSRKFIRSEYKKIHGIDFLSFFHF